MGGRKRWWGMGGGETVLNNIFKNGFIFLKCLQGFFQKKMYGLYGFFFENCTDCTDFFSKIVRIVRISSENVRIFVRICSKKFWPPCRVYLMVSWFLIVS